MATENHLIRSVDELSQSQLGARSTLSPNRSPIPHNHRRRGLPHQNNHLPDVEDDHHDPNKKLDQDVDFSGMSLHQLPVTPINLAAISKLDLSNNNLEVIPESLVARMLNVVEMDVHSNQLTNLPNSIGCLSKLLVLNVSANELHSLPRTIENCRSLEELNANFNNLTALPETIGFELINLKKLSVNSNKIAFLPYSTSHLTALRILDVRLNCLKALPDDLENLTSLQVLNVSQNFHHLSNLPDSIGLLLSLLELDASYNKIAALPPSISCLQKLQKLCVEGNPLVSPPMDVVELGLHSVRNYLTDKMNGAPENSSKKQKKSWFGRLKKHGTSNARGSSRGVPHNHVFDVRHKEGTTNFIRKNPIEAIASPRYLSNMLSPSRWFSSPQHSFSKLS